MVTDLPAAKKVFHHWPTPVVVSGFEIGNAILYPSRSIVQNWKCLYDFRTSGLNQQFIPEYPPVAGCNDTGYIVTPRADGTLPGVRVVFFPELGWGQGGKGPELRDKMIQSLRVVN